MVATEITQTESALRASEERFRQMAETIREVFWMSTADLSRTLYVSPAYENVWGKSCESLYREPRSYVDSIHPDDRQRVVAAIDGDREEGFEVEYRVVHPDGSIRWIKDRAFPIKDEAGQFYRMVGIAEDITDHKLAEEKLKRSESLLAEAQRIAHVGSFEWSLQDNTVTWSDELYRIFGLERGSINIAGEGMLVVHPDDRERVLTMVQESVAANRAYSFYFRALRPNGDERIVHTRGFIQANENKEPIRVFGVSQDVTELKRSEEQVQATYQQLRALSASVQAAREQESTRIAREIHDELGAALTSLRWGLEELGDSLSETKDLAQLASLRVSIEGMLGLTDGLMKKVRQIASELRPVGLDELGLVEAIEWQARQFETRTGIAVMCECKLERADLNRDQSTAAFRILQEALTNILRHAQATQVTLSINQTPQEFALTIQDNGRGITPDEKSDVHSLGLLGMKERAHLINAELEITGISTKGTLVSLRIPIDQVNAIEGLTNEAHSHR